MLLKKIRKKLGKNRQSSNVVWRIIFYMMEEIERLKSEMLDLLFMLKKCEELKINAVSLNFIGEKIFGNYYYFGEFGYFNFEILGGLSQYFKLHPGRKLKVVSYKDYGKIMELLFPKNIKAYYIDYDFNEVYRSCHYYQDRAFRVKIKKAGFKKNLGRDFISVSRKLIRTCKNNSVGYNFIHLLKPLKYPIQENGEKFISIFPRFRKVGSDRNLSENDWNKIIKLLLKFNYKIIVHGYASEFIKLKNKNLIYPKNIYEQIAYLNNSDLCITPASGFFNFAQNCKCDIFVILISRDVENFKKFGCFNPFDNKIYVTKQNEDYLSKLKKILEELEGGDRNEKRREKN